ncbi:MAG: MATE family efflux transporter [Bacteroidales bacterium]|nr:MATE family efflux transporter [Bacteroidales bacterium]
MHDLTQGHVGKQIFRFTVPILVGNIFHQLYQIIDSIIVGHYLGKHALAAVGASFPIIFLVLSFTIGIAMAGTVIVSQYFGAKDYEGVKRSIDTLNVFLAVTAILVSILSILYSVKIFKLMRMPEELVPSAVSFFNIFMLGTIFSFGFNGTTAVLRGMGDSKTPLYFLVTSTILNIILDLIFIVGFRWGIASVAWATVISQACALGALILYLNKRHPVIKFNPSKIFFDKKIFLKSLKIGLPVGLQQMFVALGMMALMVIVNSFGTNVIAAYSVAWRIDSFASMPGMNLAIALSAFVGQNMGARQTERVIQGLKTTLLMAGSVAIFISFIAFFWGDLLMQIFTSDRDVIAIGHQYLKIVGMFYLAFNSMFIIGAVMRGAGDTFVPMLLSLFSLWLIRLPLAYFLSKHIGEQGIWWSIPIGWTIGTILSYAYYKMGNWKNKTIVERKEMIVEA